MLQTKNELSFFNLIFIYERLLWCLEFLFFSVERGILFRVELCCLVHRGKNWDNEKHRLIVMFCCRVAFGKQTARQLDHDVLIIQRELCFSFLNVCSVFSLIIVAQQLATFGFSRSLEPLDADLKQCIYARLDVLFLSRSLTKGMLFEWEFQSLFEGFQSGDDISALTPKFESFDSRKYQKQFHTETFSISWILFKFSISLPRPLVTANSIFFIHIVMTEERKFFCLIRLLRRVGSCRFKVKTNTLMTSNDKTKKRLS